MSISVGVCCGVGVDGEEVCCGGGGSEVGGGVISGEGSGVSTGDSLTLADPIPAPNTTAIATIKIIGVSVLAIFVLSIQSHFSQSRLESLPHILISPDLKVIVRLAWNPLYFW
jgi:hypothetical protein